jgi:hypothetical protein
MWYGSRLESEVLWKILPVVESAKVVERLVNFLGSLFPFWLSLSRSVQTFYSITFIYSIPIRGSGGNRELHTGTNFIRESFLQFGTLVLSGQV